MARRCRRRRASLCAAALARIAPAAQAPVPLTPPAAAGARGQAGGQARRQASPRRPSPRPHKPAARGRTAPAPATPRRELDLAYGAYQRGYYLTAFADRDPPGRRAEGRQGDDAARRALRQRPRRRARRQEGGRMVPARRRPRRPRGDVRARHVPLRRARRTAPVASRAAKLLAAAAKLGHIGAAYNLALLYLEGQLFPQDFARAAELFRTRRPGRQSGGAIRARHPLQGGPRRAEGSGARPRGCWPRPRSPTTSTPRSNTPSRCSTAPASPRTSGRRRSCWRRPRARAIPSRRTVSPTSSRSDAACRPIRCRRSNGTSSPRPAASATFRSTTSCRSQPPDVRAAGEKAAKPWLDAHQGDARVTLLT